MSKQISGHREFVRRGLNALAVTVALGLVPGMMATAASAQTYGQPLGYASSSNDSFPSDDAMANPQGNPDRNAAQDQATQDEDAALPDDFRKTIVAFNSREAPGTVIIDTANTHLYYVLGGDRAIRYGVGVGREGFAWAGTQTVSRKAEWPDWHPPAEMIARQPYLPRFMAGGPGNPLGARAMYLGSSEYRIHGTNDPSTIGKFVSSGCIRLTNEDVEDLFSRVSVGAKVIVLPKAGAGRSQALQAQASIPAPAVQTVTHIRIKQAPVAARNDREAMNVSSPSTY
jgi:lipoprotein-anchoring transpeptidase ErfK/SrfK